MLVKIKPHLVPVETQKPVSSCETYPALAPETLKQWLDEDRDFVLIDTRNAYEIRVGKFEKAIDFDIRHFRYFPEEMEKKFGDNKDIPIVMYCTGGIRCAKGTPAMAERGFTNVYQLEGGILKYFEKVGGAHWKGDCFVFDDRVAVDPNLNETEVKQCYNCRQPVMPEEQMDPRYVVGVSCIHCCADKTA